MSKFFNKNNSCLLFNLYYYKKYIYIFEKYETIE